VPLSASGRLAALLDRLHDKGRVAKRLDLYATEYGYETSPPDPYHGVSPGAQARYLGWSTFLMWQQPRIAMWSQFELRDTPPHPARPGLSARGRWSLYQTGLLRADGTQKPAARAFAEPFWAQRAVTGGTRAVLLFGQVRPGAGRHTVRFERFDPATRTWRPEPTLGFGPDCRPQPADRRTDPAGYALAFVRDDGPARWRMAWRLPSGRWAPSIHVDVTGGGPVLRP
jgi:hypothetical protein